MQLALSQRPLDEGSSPAFYAGRTLGEVEQALLWHLLHEDPSSPSRVLLDKVAQMQRPIAVSVRHLNRWRVTWGLNRGKGRPHHAEGPRPVVSSAAVVPVTPRLSFVGVHLLAHWLDQQETFGPVVGQLQQAIEAHKRAHPDDDFALLHHREQTLRHRFQALFFAPLLGIEPHGIETREHPLRRCLAGLSQLNARQLLGQLSASMPLGADARCYHPDQARYLCRWSHACLWEPRVDAQGQDHHAGTHHGGLASRYRP